MPIRITLPYSPEKTDSLRSAYALSARLQDDQRLVGLTRPGEHTDTRNRLFFYADLTDDGESLVEELRNGGNEVERIAVRPQVDECINCGNVAETPTAVCPNCDFREIAACPHCNVSVPRQRYVDIAEHLFTCPRCGTRVRLEYNEPVWDEHGYYRQPVILVLEATR